MSVSLATSAVLRTYPKTLAVPAVSAVGSRFSDRFLNLAHSPDTPRPDRIHLRLIVRPMGSGHTGKRGVISHREQITFAVMSAGVSNDTRSSAARNWPVPPHTGNFGHPGA
jgi:hypothetical protein